MKEKHEDFVIPGEIVSELKKQGIELIFKKGWVWYDEKVFSKERFVLFCDKKETGYPYRTAESIYLNFSETDPNKEQLETGKLAYFWDGENPKSVMCGFLSKIRTEGIGKYSTEDGSFWNNCSHKNPLEK